MRSEGLFVPLTMGQAGPSTARVAKSATRFAQDDSVIFSIGLRAMAVGRMERP